MPDMEDVGLFFVQEFVIGFGFLSGLWARIGFNPEDKVVEVLLEIINTLIPSLNIRRLFGLASALGIWGILLEVISSYKIGGGLGLLAIFLAFVAGAIANPNPDWWVIPFFLAIFIGIFAPQVEKFKREHGVGFWSII